jgi:hypothetical protein
MKTKGNIPSVHLMVLEEELFQYSDKIEEDKLRSGLHYVRRKRISIYHQISV